MEEKKIRFEKNGFVLEGTTYLMPSNPTDGYNFGYAIFIPKDCEQNTTLIMHSCNTGNHVPIHMTDAIEIAKKSTYERPNHGMVLGNELKMPIMIPLIPRIEYFYTQALRRSVYNNDMTDLIEYNARRSEEDKLTMEDIAEIQKLCQNIPSQVANMIISAKETLEELGITVDDKVIAEGYSAGSCFANCFTALHPTLVKACICGGNNGLGIIPMSEFEGEMINFPLGVADVPYFNYEEFARVPQLYYIGTEDYNDSAMVKCEFAKDENGEYIIENGSRVPIRDENNNVIPILDENGRLQPRYIESFNQEEIEFIHKHLGSNPQVRYNRQEQIYRELGIDALFTRFPGDHNTVTQNYNNGQNVTDEYIKTFIKEVLQKEQEFGTPTGHHI